MGILKMKLTLLLIIMFSIVYGVCVGISRLFGITDILFYFILAGFFIFIQYMLGPKMVEWVMRVRYVSESEAPNLYRIVRELAHKAKIPMPRIGIAQTPLPNAFAFGRNLSDGRVCVTTGIMNLLNEEELKAVLGHEISHLKNRDVLFITMLSVIPLVFYLIARNFLFYSLFYRRRRESGGYVILVGLGAMILYFLTNLLVLYASRIREYFADRGSVELGNPPSKLASALYKLVYGTAKTPKEHLKEVEGLKAFFLNDVSKSVREISELAELDLDHSGTIDPYELERLKKSKIKLTFADRIMELLSTHPNMLKRIKQLSEYQR